MRNLLLVLCVGLLDVGAAHAQHGFWQPDERVLITSFLYARSIATDQRYVYVATTNGLEIYDQAFQRWLPPSTIEDGYPALERPARMAYDAREGGVWLLTEAQTVHTYQHALQRWQQRFSTDVPDDVRARLQQGVGSRDPALQIMRNFAGRDAAGRSWQVTGLVPGERNDTYWAATYGGNFSFVDTRNLSSQPYLFGTLSRGVSALAADASGYIWLGGDGAGQRNGIARTDPSLQQWTHFEARVLEVPQSRVHTFSVSAAGFHATGADGVFEWRENRWSRVLDTDARALAYTTGRLWVAGRGALGWLDAAGSFQRAEFPLHTVHDLVAEGDTLWIGAESGLYRWVQGQLQQLAGGPQIRDVALTARGAVMLSPSGVRLLAGSEVGLPLRNAALDRVGRPTAVHAQGDRVWIGGTAGLAEWNTANDTWRYLTIPTDIPEGPIHDVLAVGDHIWVATPAGALRLEWN